MKEINMNGKSLTDAFKEIAEKSVLNNTPRSTPDPTHKGVELIPENEITQEMKDLSRIIKLIKQDTKAEIIKLIESMKIESKPLLYDPDLNMTDENIEGWNDALDTLISMNTNELRELEGMKPALREWYWLIQQDKQTEDEFVSDMTHRMELLIKEKISLALAKRDEEVKEIIKACGHQQDDDTIWCNMDEILQELDK